MTRRPGNTEVTCLPCDDPKMGLLGVVAWYEDPITGEEVSQTFQWPLMPGKDPLKPEEQYCTTLAEIGPLTDDDLPCDNPMALTKGWVRHCWDRGVAEIRSIRVRDLKQLGPHETVMAVLKELDAKAKANLERVMASQPRFIYDSLWKPLLTKEFHSSWGAQAVAIEDFRCFRALAQAARQAP